MSVCTYCGGAGCNTCFNTGVGENDDDLTDLFDEGPVDEFEVEWGEENDSSKDDPFDSEFEEDEVFPIDEDEIIL